MSLKDTFPVFESRWSDLIFASRVARNSHRPRGLRSPEGQLKRRASETFGRSAASLSAVEPRITGSLSFPSHKCGPSPSAPLFVPDCAFDRKWVPASLALASQLQASL